MQAHTRKTANILTNLTRHNNECKSLLTNFCADFGGQIFVNRVEYAHNKNIFKSWANGRSIYYKLPTVLHPGLTEFFYVEFALQGCKHIKANGGKTSAQDMSAEVDFRPLSAQAAGFADFVLLLNKIPAKLKRLAAALKT